MIGQKAITMIKKQSMRLLGLGVPGFVALFGFSGQAFASIGGVSIGSIINLILGGAGGCGGTGIGAVMCNVVESSSELPFLLSGICYLLGLVLAVWAILKLKDHVINPNQTPLSDSMKRFIAGGAFFALPIVVEAAYNTVAEGLPGSQETSFNTSMVLSGGGLDAMVTALMADIWGPVHILIGGFAYLAGLILVAIGISRLLKSSQEGPRGPGGMGTIATFLVAGVLLSANAIMGAFNVSLFGTETITTYATLSFSGGLNGTELAHIHNVISAVLAFVMVIGWISFIRGWFIVREVAEGSQQASLMAGMTHIFGGALAVNLGPVLRAVQETFGITGYGISFA